MHHLIYLHGFLSSPLSSKALVTKAYLTKHYPATTFHCPQLSGNIDRAISQLRALVQTIPVTQLRFIGSSMGGFLATYATEVFGGRAVLINPAVTPHELLSDYLGKHINPYSNEVFYVHTEHLALLKHCVQKRLKTPQNYMVLLQTGDETLDYTQAADKYQHANLVIEDGGDHSFVNYAQWLPKIVAFLNR